MSNIPLYIYIHHIFFSNSFVDGYFHVLTVVNSAAMNTRVHVSFWIMFSFPLDIYTGVELQGHMVALPLVFQGTSILFSIVYCDPHSQRLWHSQQSRNRCFFLQLSCFFDDPVLHIFYFAVLFFGAYTFSITGLLWTDSFIITQ